MMKRCPRCGSVYEDTYQSCPVCKVPFVPLDDGPRSRTSNPPPGARTQASYPPPGSRSQASNPPPGSRTQASYPPPGGRRPAADGTEQALTFERRAFGSVVINGAVAESTTQQYYQSRSTKVIHALFSGEPYQLGHTTFVTIFRVEEHRLRGFPEQARDITVYGNMQNIFAVGDDVTVHAKRRGPRFVARRIFNHSINSPVHIQPYIPAGAIRLIALALALLAGSLIWALATADYVSAGQQLAARISGVLPTILLIVGIFYAVKSVIKPK